MEVPTEAIALAWFVLSMLLVLLPKLCRGKPEEDEEEENVVAYRRAAPVSAYPPAAVVVQPRPAVVPAMKLGHFPYSAEGRRASEKLVCAICLEVFVHGDICSEVPACRHLFHRDCIGVWMKTKTTCPLCRVNIVTGARRPSVPNEIV